MTKFSGKNNPLVPPTGRPRVLVAPLDWGLGHATRCIPVIYELQKQNTDVWLAGEKAQERLLKSEFPHLPFLPLRGYRVRYSRSASGLWLTLLRQMPRIWRTVQREKKWLAHMVKRHQFDLVISDNRFGLSHPAIPCIFMTHQLTIRTSLGKWLDKQAQRMNYQFVRKFTECWVPDLKQEPNLGGQLSHPVVFPETPVRYAGILSRLDKKADRPEPGRLFISLSGPEPQRTIWEDKLINDIVSYNGQATIVRGLPDSEKILPSTTHIRFYNHLPSTEYAEEMSKAEWIICRSGYSTVMDIARMGKKAVLVPTPGQPEQEYLARHLSENGFAPFISQAQFSIVAAIKAANSFNYKPFKQEADPLPELVRNIVSKVAVR